MAYLDCLSELSLLSRRKDRLYMGISSFSHFNSASAVAPFASFHGNSSLLLCCAVLAVSTNARGTGQAIGSETERK